MGGTYWSTDVWGTGEDSAIGKDSRDDYLAQGSDVMAQQGIDQALVYEASG